MRNESVVLAAKEGFKKIFLNKTQNKKRKHFVELCGKSDWIAKTETISESDPRS